MELSTMLGMLGEGLLVSAQIFCIALVGSLPLGVLVADRKSVV